MPPASPVPYGRPVEDEDDAWVAAQEIGLPVVVKPQDGNQGKGISVNLTTEEQVRHAYRVAIEFRDDIMVEKFLSGHDWRLLVIGDKLIAAARRDPPLVIGDGKHTVRQLVDIVNSDPRRSDGHATSLTKIRFDEIALARLAEQGYSADSVPPRGVRVVLRNNANLSTGGTATDVTDDVHPELAAAAVAAAQTATRARDCGQHDHRRRAARAPMRRREFRDDVVVDKFLPGNDFRLLVVGDKLDWPPPAATRHR